MPEFPVQVTITRPSSDLILSAANGYYIARNGIGPGEASWRRTTAQSPFVAGRSLIAAVRDVETISMRVRVESDSPTNLHHKINQLTDALSQFSYVLSVQIDGVVYSWRCEPADWSIGDGGQWQDLFLRQNMQYVSFSIPRKPGTVAGS